MNFARRSFAFPAISAILALAITASVAYAFPRGKGGRGLNAVLGHSSELGLTDEQIAQIESLQTGQEESFASHRDSVRSRREALADLLQEESINRPEAEARIDELVKEMAEMKRARLQTMLSLSEILSQEQRLKLREIRKAKRGMRGRGRHGRFAPPDAADPQSP